MAIVIPSKNIYNIEYNRVRNNVIDKVAINQTHIEPKKEFAVEVHTATTRAYERYTAKNYEHIYRNVISGIGKVQELYAYHKVVPFYANLVTVRIPKMKDNKYVSNLVKQDENGEHKNKITIYYGVDLGDAEGTATIDEEFNTTLSYIRYSFTYKGEGEQVDSIQVPNSYTYETDNADGIGKVSATAKTNFVDTITNITGKLDAGEDEKYYWFKFNVLNGYEEVNLGGQRLAGTTDWEPGVVTLIGECKRVYPIKTEITVYGNTITIDLSENSVPYGQGTKPVELESNELIQEGTTTDGVPTTQYLCENVISQYQNGKETVTLLCDINNYYDENGEKKISIDGDTLPMTFSIGDICIPMIYGADGVDSPLSTHPNSTKKTYRVVGVETYSKGVVWQKIFLQEVALIA